MHAYDSLFLDDAMENLGDAVEYAIYGMGMTGQEFLDLFLVSGIAEAFSCGEVRYLSGMSGLELTRRVMEKCHLNIEMGDYEVRIEYSPEYWVGWALAYYQWYSARSFSQILKKINFQVLMNLYGVLHEADVTKIATVFDEFFITDGNTNLAQIRIESGMSQAQLARVSGISLRSIQMYEQRNNDINKAQLNRLLALARALGCRMENLLE